MKDLIMKSPGKPDVNLGGVYAGRPVGAWYVQLTHDESGDGSCWWIVATRDGWPARLMGFIDKVYPQRRVDAFEAYAALTQAQLDDPYAECPP